MQGRVPRDCVHSCVGHGVAHLALALRRGRSQHRGGHEALASVSTGTVLSSARMSEREHCRTSVHALRVMRLLRDAHLDDLRRYSLGIVTVACAVTGTPVCTHLFTY